MKKIISLFARNYDTDRLVRDELVPGAEWVVSGEGVATVKVDGTSCMIRDGKLYKRYDRKEGKPAPEGWEACEEAPNENTGHWPGWVPVSDGPNDKWFRDAMHTTCSRAGSLTEEDKKQLHEEFDRRTAYVEALTDGTYELVGPHIQSNPYNLAREELWRHGAALFPDPQPPRTFNELKVWLEANPQYEGIVWHHADGRMVKIKRRDFGLPWGKSKGAK